MSSAWSASAADRSEKVAALVIAPDKNLKNADLSSSKARHKRNTRTKGFTNCPTWRAILEGARPVLRPHGSQCHDSRTLTEHSRDRVVIPSLPPSSRALLRSQAGPHAGAWLTAIPCEPILHTASDASAWHCRPVRVAVAPKPWVWPNGRRSRRPCLSMPQDGILSGPHVVGCMHVKQITLPYACLHSFYITRCGLPT